MNPIGVAYNFFAGVTPTLLADDINLDSPPGDIRMMLRTARLTQGWQNWSVASKLGTDPELAGLDTPAKLLVVTDTQPERLLNSRSGRLHLFPGMPEGVTVAFRHFQARGGFLVSAERVEGETSFVEIESRREVECQVMNPWPGREVAVREARSGQVLSPTVDRTHGECLVFPTRRGGDYVLQPR